MRAGALVVLLAGACGEPAPAQAPAQPPPTKPAASPPAPTQSAPPPAPNTEDFACGTYVTAADITRACSVETEAEITRGEGGHPLNTCSRKFRGPEGRSVSFKLAVHPSLEKVSTIPITAGATEIPDLGDAAYVSVEDKGGLFDWHTVEVRSGARIVYLRSIGESGGTPLCTTAQLTELAREAFARLSSPD